MAPDRKIMAVEVKASGASFDVGSPKALFEAAVDNPIGSNRYDVSGDGQQFLISISAENEIPVPLTVVLNWLEARKR